MKSKYNSSVLRGPKLLKVYSMTLTLHFCNVDLQLMHHFQNNHLGKVLPSKLAFADKSVLASIGKQEDTNERAIAVENGVGHWL